MLITLILLLANRLKDLIVASKLGLVPDGSLQINLFILENMIGIILLIAILLVSMLRKNASCIFRAGLLTLLGLILFCLKIGLVSFV